MGSKGFAWRGDEDRCGHDASAPLRVVFAKGGSALGLRVPAPAAKPMTSFREAPRSAVWPLWIVPFTTALPVDTR